MSEAILPSRRYVFAIATVYGAVALFAGLLAVLVAAAVASPTLRVAVIAFGIGAATGAAPLAGVRRLLTAGWRSVWLAIGAEHRRARA